MALERPHGRFLAGEAGELVGVSGTTIGQWARRGYIRASRSTGDPHGYSLEDGAEAWGVPPPLERGVGHAGVRRTIAALGDRGRWPLLTAPLATTGDNGSGRVVLCASDGTYALSVRGGVGAVRGRGAAAGGSAGAAAAAPAERDGCPGAGVRPHRGDFCRRWR